MDIDAHSGPATTRTEGGPTRALRTDLGVLEELAAVDGRSAVDVGCGDGSLVRWLAAHGAQALGIEVSERALSRARAGDPDQAGHYRVGCAQALPLPDTSVDLAIFWRSLHHVAPNYMGTALSEARRVLRPDGLVYVAEPLTEGSYFEVLRPVDDETTVRALAQSQIAAVGGLGLERARTVEYEVLVPIADLAHLRDRLVAVDPTRAARFDALAVELQRAAESLAERDVEGWCFRQPMRVDLLRRVD